MTEVLGEREILSELRCEGRCKGRNMSQLRRAAAGRKRKCFELMVSGVTIFWLYRGNCCMGCQ